MFIHPTRQIRPIYSSFKTILLFKYLTLERRHLKYHSLRMHKGLPVIEEKNTNQMFRTSGFVVEKKLKLKN